MERPTPPPETNARFWQASPEYHGVLAVVGDYRLTISPNGKQYQLQRRAAPDRFAVVTWRKSLARLRADLKPAVAEAIPEGLPDDPREYQRPWADEMKAAGDRFKRAMSQSDQFAGVIANGKRARLVILPRAKDGKRGPRYAFQVPDGAKWRSVCKSARASYLHAIVFGQLHETQPAAPACGDLALQSAVARLPESAAEYNGRKLESLETVQAALGRPRLKGAPPLKSDQDRQSARQRRKAGARGGTPTESPQSASSVNLAAKAVKSGA